MSEAENVPEVQKDEAPKIEEKPITAKDPKRVEQGKRLAAISKEAKEKKMRERIKEEEFSYIPWISYGVSIISTFGLFYFLFSGGKNETDVHPMTVIRESPKKEKPKKKFESFQ